MGFLCGHRKESTFFVWHINKTGMAFGFSNI